MVRREQFRVHGWTLSPWMIRPLALLLTFLLFFSGSPALFALEFSAGARSSGSGSQAGGGQGSAPSLQNAGAASAALTAALAKQSLAKSQVVITGLNTAQSQAAAAAKANTANGAINGKTVVNGLQITTPTGANQAPGLVPYYNAQNPAPSGPNIPSGSVPVPGTWSGVQSVSQTTTGSAASTAPSSATVTITQNQQSAYLYWSHFNVGPQTTVHFNQSGNTGSPGTWIAFNKVMTASDPSHIFGKINAPGQVYILNQGGILFHAGSEVNVQSLVASTLPINEVLAGDALDAVPSSGLVNFPNAVPQFLFNAVDKTAYDPNNAGNVTVGNALGNVVVEQGATINASVNAKNSGGLVALIGPNVQNGGAINTPNGQTVLAAGLQVGLTPHPSSDPSLRGLDVTVGQVSGNNVSGAPITLSPVEDLDGTASAGRAQNTATGLITANEGDVTITGSSVSQAGGIASSTSVSFNGRVDLLANYGAQVNLAYTSDGNNGPQFLYRNTGTVDLGADSAIQILPEWNNTATITGTSLALNSIVSVIGQTITMGNGAIIEAPGAVKTLGAADQTGSSLSSGVTLQAGSWYDVSGYLINFVSTTGEVALNEGSVIDVSGSTDVQVNSSQNFVTVQLRGAQLAGEPLQDNAQNPVYGQNLTVDIRDSGTYNGAFWIGTPLGDATGYVGLIQRGVGQLTTSGGSVSISAGESVSMASGSLVNVSGGWVQYGGGSFSTTELKNSFGQLVPISHATPDQIYTAVLQGPSVEELPYYSGGNGGSITIKAPAAVLNGSLAGVTVAGQYQLRASATKGALPSPSSLNISLQGSLLSGGILLNVSPDTPTVTFEDGQTSTASQLFLSPELVSDGGFGNLMVISHDGNIIVPSGVSLNAGVGGSISLEGANITVDGSLIAPSGSISLKADLAPLSVINTISTPSLNAGLSGTGSYLDVLTDSSGNLYLKFDSQNAGAFSYYSVNALNAGSTTPVSGTSLTHLNSGVVSLDQGAELTTAGMIADDFPGSPNAYAPLAIQGGKVSLAAYQVNLSTGSLIDVSGGALIPVKGNNVYGAGGTLGITAGQDSKYITMSSGSLALGSALLGYGGFGQSGGTLSITAPAIQIGGSAPSGVTSISSAFFNQGGFSKFNLAGIGIGEGSNGEPLIPGMLIAQGTKIDPVVLSRTLIGSPLSSSLEVAPLPESVGSSVSLNLSAVGITDPSLNAIISLLVTGQLLVEPGSSILLSPHLSVSGENAAATAGSLTLNSVNGTLAILGSESSPTLISAPGGSITVLSANSFPTNLQNLPATQVTADISPYVTLSAAGEALYTRDPQGIRSLFGSLLAGGSISLSGNVVMEEGSELDVSGASGSFQLRNPYGFPILTPMRLDTPGGTITLSGSQMLTTDALLVAAAGGPTATGGSLSISSGRYYQTAEQSLQANNIVNLNLTITQNSPSISVGFDNSGSAALGQFLPLTGTIEGGGYLAVSSFANGGFANVTLGGNVFFNGGISIAIPGQLDVATGGVLSANAPVNLTASYVSLGTPFVSPLAPNSGALTSALGTYVTPSAGTGALFAQGQIIDVGNLSLQNTAAATLSSSGPIRGDGTLDMAGALSLHATEIYPVTGTQFTLIAYNYNTSSGTATASTGGGITTGSITISQAGSMATPLSAGGNLSLYANAVNQGGSLVAPFGIINLGWSGSGTQPGDPMTGAGEALAQNPLLVNLPLLNSLTLTSGSITSVSAVDPISGTALTIPYGSSSDGSSWDAPSGANITTLGVNLTSSGKSLPSAVVMSAQSVTAQSGSLIDLQGGGEMTAAQWVSGLGGTINLLGASSGQWSPTVAYPAGSLVNYGGSLWSARQANAGVTPVIGINWTQIPQEYAIVPGYQASYSPLGYDSGPSVGSMISIASGAGLPAGNYTLLPASYANQSGAYLISEYSSMPVLGTEAVTQTDGSVLVSGALYNTLSGAAIEPYSEIFRVLSPSLISKSVDYKLLKASSFFAGKISDPRNAERLSVQTASGMQLSGNIRGIAGVGGNGAEIDLSALSPIAITTDGNADGLNGLSGTVLLGAQQIDSWSFGSLLIGGLRAVPSDGQTLLTVNAPNVTLEPSVALTGNDIILAATGTVAMDQGSSITASGVSVAPDEIISVVGDGAFIRVSADGVARDIRSPGNGGLLGTGNFQIAQGCSLSGNAVTLDSSGAGFIDPSVSLNGNSFNIAAGAISVAFDDSVNSGLNMAGASLIATLSSAQSLNLTSYSTIAFHGSGTLGGTSMANLCLHAGELLGDNSGAVALRAGNVLLDNSSGGIDPSGGNPIATGGSLEIDSAVLTLGEGALSVGGFQSMSMIVTGGLQGSGAGTFITAGNLSITTPLLTGEASANTSVTATGSLSIVFPTIPHASLLSEGLGASLSLTGSTGDVSITTGYSIPNGNFISPITLQSGRLSISALSGNLNLDAPVDVSGRAVDLKGSTEYTTGGTITLTTPDESINLGANSQLNMGAPLGGGSAGSLVISAPEGGVVFTGSLNASAANGAPGNFSMDVAGYNQSQVVGGVVGSGGSVQVSNLGNLEQLLTSANFLNSQIIRIRTGDVLLPSSTTARVYSYDLSADSGSIRINGGIEANNVPSVDSGGNPIRTGGSISISAGNSLIVDGTLDVSANNYKNSGAGGSIFLSAGAAIIPGSGSVSGGTYQNALIANPSASLNLSGAVLNFGVVESSSSLQDVGGVLHLRTPQTALSNVSLSGTTISGASAIELEGYSLYDLTGINGVVPVQNTDSGYGIYDLATIEGSAKAFYGSPGTYNSTSGWSGGANSAAVNNLLAAYQTELGGAFSAPLNIAPGIELMNQSGNIVFQQNLNNSGVDQGDWDLSGFRVGANSAPGFLDIRASGNVIFNASLSDGFASSSYTANLQAQNIHLPVNFQSWSYQISAGADLAAANASATLPGQVGSVMLGVPYQNAGGNGSSPAGPTVDSGVNAGGPDATTAESISGNIYTSPSGNAYNYYQVIRTGTGNISIDTSGDLQFWNQFASIYTAGTQVTDPTLGGTFDTPRPNFANQNLYFYKGFLGHSQQNTAYTAQYSYSGGDIAVHAGGNITQLAYDANGNVVTDSVGEVPTNWLYRRGAVNPLTGNFLVSSNVNVGEVESTSWWVDFSNFFDNFGALGGGNITLTAAGNISNINASIPTNMRLSGYSPFTVTQIGGEQLSAIAAGLGLTTGGLASFNKITGNPIISNGTVIKVPVSDATAQSVELGGGNLDVQAGENIDAGVYYLEKGQGVITAGGGIITNPTRDPDNPVITGGASDSSLSYLPTTFFLGKGSFNISAGGSIIMGPVANTFLTPQGVNNGYLYKTYFSTYASTDQVNVQSLGGSVMLVEDAVTANDSIAEPMLQLWMEPYTLEWQSGGSGANPTDVANYQPWLRLAESDIPNVAPLLSIAPPTLNVAAISGDITMQGSYTTMPSPVGNVTLVASGNINGLADVGNQTWLAASINISDANPSVISTPQNPSSLSGLLFSLGGLSLQNNYLDNMNSDVQLLSGTTPNPAQNMELILNPTGSYFGPNGTLQAKENLNDSTILHQGVGVDQVPVQIVAGKGNISGLTLYSAKEADVEAGGDITDVGLFIQNNQSSDLSIVSAGGNIVLYDPTSPLQIKANASEIAGSQVSIQSGDIQISGPGTLEVLAGGNVDLGNNPGSSDPTLNVGITSIGNSRNPALPFQGADVIVSAGMDLPTGLSSPGVLALNNFAQSVLSTSEGATYLTELSSQMAYTGDSLLSELHTASDLGPDSSLTAEQQARLELQLFYIVLRDVGRNYSNPESAGYRSYATARQAIQTLENGNTGSGNIITWSQDISTVNGGNIDLIAPGGGVTMGAINYKATGSAVAPGIITEGGGAINIFTKNNVSIGIGRIFTLKGGDIMIWSDQGNIAAGASSKTVQSAPPTQVLVDPQSALVEADLAGLATGGGIGTLETVIGIPPSAVDLDAPSGVIDAGDAGIRSSGNLHLAATAILNAANIAVGGLSVGVPVAASSSAPAAAAPAAPAAAAAPSSAASTAAAAASSAADKTADKGNTTQEDSTPSEYTITIDGYGGGDGGDDDSTKKAADAAVAPIQASL